MDFVFNATGEYMDLQVRQGVTLGPIPHSIVLDDGNDTPFDLTGYVFRGSVKSEADPAVSVEFNFTTDRLDEGVYTFGLTDEQTATLQAGKYLSSSKSRHTYETEMESPEGKIVPLFFGELRVQPRA